MKRLLMTGALLFGAVLSGKAAMAKKIDREALAKKIKTLDGLNAEERSELLGLLSEQKKYGLVWEEKPEDVEEAMREQLPVLAEVKERAIVRGGDFDAEAQRRREVESGGSRLSRPNSADATSASLPFISADAPNHILIEGDNLHALTCLTYTHANKIDVIYIDPPYNTGNKDFVYNDRFVDKEDAFRHSKWLSFMAKRLRIAKGLLSDKGVIFISIDDNEQAQLKLLCDEIFGEENFLAQCVRKRRESQANLSKNISPIHEYVFIYAKSSFATLCKVPPRVNRKDYKNPDNDPRGPYVTMPCTNKGGSVYSVLTPEGDEITEEWRFSPETYQSLLADNRLVFPRGGHGKPRYKLFLEEKLHEGVLANTWLDEVASNQEGTREVKDIFGDLVFNNPKPTGLVLFCCQLASKKHSTVLDFFAGSGTTLHAVMKLNAEDGGKRTCILVTNNENGICEKVTYERNRRVIQGYVNAKGEEVPGLSDNSLRYYKTEFVPRKPSPRNARALMAASVDLLCVKNDLYNEAPRFFGKKLKKSAGRYFNDGRGRRMLVLFDETTVPSVAETIREASFDGKVKIYVFSHGDYAYNEEFEEVADKVELCALPTAILNAYRRVVGKYRPQEEAE